MYQPDNDKTFENWPGSPSAELNRESWKVFQVMGEFVDGFDKMAQVHPAVSIQLRREGSSLHVSRMRISSFSNDVSPEAIVIRTQRPKLIVDYRTGSAKVQADFSEWPEEVMKLIRFED